MQTIQKLFAVTSILLLLIVVNAYSQSTTNEIPKEQKTVINNDTIPTKASIDIKKIENDLKVVWKNIEVKINKIDWAKMESDINKALKNINVDKAFKEAQNAINDIDVKKFANELKENSAKNWNEMELELQKGISKLEQIDVQEMQLEMEKIKIALSTTEKEKLKQNLEKIQPELKKKLQEIKTAIEKLKFESEKKKLENTTYNLRAVHDDLFPFQI